MPLKRAGYNGMNNLCPTVTALCEYNLHLSPSVAPSQTLPLSDTEWPI